MCSIGCPHMVWLLALPWLWICEMQESSWRALELFQEMQQGGLHGVGHRTRGSITVRSWPLHVRAYQPTYSDSTLLSRICQLWFATTSNPHLIHEYWREYLYSHLNVQKYIYMYKHEESWFLDGEQNYLVGFFFSLHKYMNHSYRKRRMCQQFELKSGCHFLSFDFAV